MGINFDLPWRIHWRLGEGGAEHLARQVRSCRPLSIVIELQDPRDLDGLGLPWDGTEVVAVLEGWRLCKRELTNEGIRRWEFPVTDRGEAGEIRKRFFPEIAPGIASLRWTPERDGLSRLPDILDAAARYGFGLTLPNRHANDISSRGNETLPLPEEIKELDRENILEVIGRLGVDHLRIHDFIISEFLGLDGPEPGGCEAGNSIAFIDGDGIVYPCCSLLIPLGDLNEDDFAGIWKNPARDRIRKDLLELPSVCRSCSLLAACQGGCRGIVYHLFGHYGAPDPLCLIGAGVDNGSGS